MPDVAPAVTAVAPGMAVPVPAAGGIAVPVPAAGGTMVPVPAGGIAVPVPGLS